MTICLALLASLPLQTTDPAMAGHQLVPERITVGLADASQDASAWLATISHPSLAGAVVLRQNRLGNVDLELADPADAEAALEVLAEVEGVAFVERVWRGVYLGTPNDPLFSSQDHLRNLGGTGGTVDADVDAEHAWDLTTGDPNIIIAAIDSGVETNHPDISPNVWANAGEIPFNGVDDDNNGFVDDVQGWNFETSSANPAGGSHGTWVAGVISARTGNGVGVAGLAGGMGDQPGCSLMAIGVGAFSPQTDLLDDAIVYATDNGARVITLSLTVQPSAAVEAAIDYADAAGVFIDCAAGNGFFGPGPVSYPATLPKVVAVGGTTHDDVPWTGANAGPEVRIAAQAEDVFTTAVGGNYEAISGTSFAAPQVGALAGLMLSLDPNLTPDEILFIMAGSADDVGQPGFDPQTGLGRINAWQALLATLEPDCDGNGQIDVFEIAMNMATDADGDNRIDSCQELFPGLASVSLSAGGNVDFTLDADGALAGGDSYFLLGSLSGVTPGTPAGGLQVPLVIDAYTDLTATLAGAAPFLNFTGVLDGAGDGTASLQLAAGTAPALAGRVAYHAFVTLDASTLAFDVVSNPAALELLP